MMLTNQFFSDIAIYIVSFNKKMAYIQISVIKVLNENGITDLTNQNTGSNVAS